MSNKINLDVTANTANAIKGFQKIQNEILKTGRTAEKTSRKLNGANIRNAGSASGGFMSSLQNLAYERLQGFDKWGIGNKIQSLSQMGGGFGRFGGMLARGGPYAAAIAAGISPAIALGYIGNKRAQQGQQLFTQERTLEQRLGNIQRNQGGSGFVKGLTNDLQQMAVKGKIPLDELTKSASRMLLAFRGNQSEVKKWVTIIADMSAATGESVDFFADLIARAEQFGTVEASVLTQMNEKGIPIFSQLAELLGVSTEQAKSLAEQGKITAQQFKTAAQAAHAISTAGANQNNVVHDAAYYENQIQHLQNSTYADTYSRRLNEMQTRRARERYQREQEYYNDPDIQNFHEEWARICVGIVEVGESLKDGLADLTRSVSAAASDLWNWVDDKLNGTQDFKAMNATNNLLGHSLGLDTSARFHGVSLAELAYNMEEKDSVVKLSETIEQLQSDIRETERRIANSYVDDENRRAGEEAIARAKEQLAILQQTLEQKQRDISAERERQRLAARALELQTQALTSNPSNNEDFVKAWNLNNRQNIFRSIEQVQREYESANLRIRQGSGTDADASFIQFFKPMIERIEKENEQARAREDFMLQQRAKSGDTNARMQVEFSSLVEQMRKLEFGETEINDFMTNQRNEAIRTRENKLGGIVQESANLQRQIQQWQSAFNHAFCAREFGNKVEYERGAWGQGLRIESPDTAAYQAAQQLKTMEETNAKLQEQINLFKCEINAIKRLNLSARTI